ncbi:hypothetical protein GF324_08145 [bacterium]|nr:hypothetical protein [bacterium]
MFSRAALFQILTTGLVLLLILSPAVEVQGEPNAGDTNERTTGRETPVSLPGDKETTRESLLENGRRLYYRAVEHKPALDSALVVFETLRRRDPEHEGRYLAYIGSLTALRGKHAFWPAKKLKLSNRGLALLDSAVALAPRDIEALFIHGSTNHHLPFFFGRADRARASFESILELLPSHMHEYDRDLVVHAVRFMREEMKWDDSQTARLRNIEEGVEEWTAHED